MSSVSMRRVELLLLKSDIDAVLKYLGNQQCFQIIYPDELERIAHERLAGVEESDQEKALVGQLDEAQRKLDFIGTFFGMAAPQNIVEDVHLPDDEMLSKIDILYERCATEKRRFEEQGAKVDQLAESVHEAKAFVGLSRPFDEFEKFSYVSIQIGKVSKEKIDPLVKALGTRAVIVPLGDEGTLLAASSRKGRFALETELSKAGFEKKSPPAGVQGVPAEAISALERAYNAEKLRLGALLNEKKGLTEQYGELWQKMTSSVRLKQSLILVEHKLESTKWVYRLSGWVPADRIDRMNKDLLSMLGNRISIRIFDPQEQINKKGGKVSEEVPVLLKHNAFVSAFQGIVLSYGTPLYGDIDPTPFVAFFFTLLFSIMFGDLGQGMVIAALGFAMLKAKRGLLARYTKFAIAFISAGLGSMVMGILDGSFFANESVLVPLERVLTGFFLGAPRDRFLQIMPQDNITAMFYFFGFTLAVGVIINSTGLIINMINLARRKEYGEAIFSKTGLGGSLLFWWAIGIVLRLILGGKLGLIDVPGLGIPLLALFLAEPLKAKIDRAQGKVHEQELSLSDALIDGAVGLLEVVIYFASNSLSFLRVGAFALAHAVLSFVIFTMAGVVRGSSASGLVFEILIYLIGNAIIIGLEGLIVTIQVIRLQYYEFFSKFFTRTGKTFKPVSFPG
ncbi:MAG: V-type ATPase 116kDa subunit family protein [Rectinema sp.]